MMGSEMELNNLNVFIESESEVRSYCRRFNTIFTKAKGSSIFGYDGSVYIDFLSGAGALNFGHNNTVITKSVTEYIDSDGIMMGLDLHTEAKRDFIKTFQETILSPRGLDYKLQFTSPSGTSVVESAVKLAKKYTGRSGIVSFTNAFHGMSATSLSLTGSKHHRQENMRDDVIRLPYEGYMGDELNTVEYFRKLLNDRSSGIDLPAAIILETVQGEGGLNVASSQWLQEVSALAKEFGILLIVDDIQAGCGRTGTFFSFERANIVPDLVCMSKSIGGIGLPLAILLINPELDIWSAGEDNGTFRGNNLAFVASKAMLDEYWESKMFEEEMYEKSNLIHNFLNKMCKSHPNLIKSRKGLGFMQGIEFYDAEHTSMIIDECFNQNLIIESCGPEDQVLKLMPALTIELKTLAKGLSIIESSISSVSIYLDKLSEVESS